MAAIAALLEPTLFRLAPDLEQATHRAQTFTQECHKLAGLIIQPHKSNTLAMGMNTHTTTRVTEREVKDHAKHPTNP